ncbi:MAG: PTS mannitol transporter subunit IICBA [Clostridiales bacterium]|jgi:PTS system mannitol-specific IIC component|nr:PTS mannitol transporter subunit IICBA [Clostridiales bacterium]
MKENVQKAGRFLSGMVMPNMGGFIAWGLITSLFIAAGWLPNEKFATLVDPMLKYMLPLLIGYTGGYAMHKQRGAVVGAIATIGVIVGAEIPMFMGAMIAGPLGGYAVKKFDGLVEGKIPAGFEMLVNNFSSGIIGAILALVGLVAINPVCLAITSLLSAGVQFFVDRGLLPLTAIFVEPAKVLFLNNAINHGIFTPLGIEQANSLGKSIFFMIESNPGPGIGLLLAYMFLGKGTAKSSAPGAAIFHFFGGIHEVYFPYVLMNPLVIVGTIAGNASGILVLQILNGGLVAAASPGSIFAELMMTPRGGFAANILGILISGGVSFAISSVVLKFFGKEEDLEAAQQKIKDMKAESKGLAPASTANVAAAPEEVKKIVFACDAGMGSSAMGATMLRKKLKAAGIEDIEVVHAPVSEIPSDAQVIVTHRELSERAAKSKPGAKIVAITNFMGAPEYESLVKELVDARSVLKN